MSRHGAFGAVIGCLTIGLAAFNADAQISPPGPSPPGSQRATTQAAGTAVIRGRVYDRDNGQPLRRALVRATPSEVVAGHLEPFARENQVTTTDEQGRYELNELRPGHYTVTASKGTYFGLSYDQARPTDSVKLIEVLEGQTVDKVDVRLPRGGVITGHVVDENGDPMPSIQVAAMRSQFV
jgi:protocatechuate 3,4-dioxygenase beta subunit